MSEERGVEEEEGPELEEEGGFSVLSMRWEGNRRKVGLGWWYGDILR